MTNQKATVGVAIAIPEPWGDDLQERRASYRDRLAWTIPTHITLLPPMQVRRSRLPDVDAHLRRVCADEPSFRIVLGPAETFRPVTDTAYVTVGKGFDECVRLEKEVRSGPLSRSLPFEYHPHVTLAVDVPEPTLDQAVADHADFYAEFMATTVTRYSLGEDGIWLPEQDFVLGRH